MNIVMITKFVPLPADSGGKRRSLAVLEALTALGDVTLCAFREPHSDVEAVESLGVRVRAAERPAGAAALSSGLVRTRSLSAARFWSPELARAVAGAASGGIDHVQVEYTQLAPYANGVRARTRALDMHNVESSLADSFAGTRRGAAALPYRLEAAALRRLERRATASFDLVTVVSEPDRRRLGAPDAVVAPNGWVASPRPPDPAAEPVAAFVALMGWAPNDDAARWLGREIWPLVRAGLPDARLLLVGRDPSAAVRALHGSAGIEVTGSVDDVQPHLARARIGLAPLRAGGGSRLKILEALDAGRPVVATSKGAEGLEDLIGEGVVVADGAEGVAAEIARLLGDPAAADELGKRGRAAVGERYSWRTTLAPFVDALRALQSGRVAG